MAQGWKDGEGRRHVSVGVKAASTRTSTVREAYRLSIGKKGGATDTEGARGGQEVEQHKEDWRAQRGRERMRQDTGGWRRTENEGSSQEGL